MQQTFRVQGHRGARPGRVLRLFVCGVLRQQWHLLPDPRSRAAVEAAERLADGHPVEPQVVADAQAAAAEAQHASDQVRLPDLTERRCPAEEPRVLPYVRSILLSVAAKTASEACDPVDARFRSHTVFRAVCIGCPEDRVEVILPGPGLSMQVEPDWLPALARDLFAAVACPPVKVSKKWRTATVAALARGCYDARDFSRLPVLADALEDAGCDTEPLLAHLRGPGPHVRGCWVVDAVLGLG